MWEFSRRFYVELSRKVNFTRVLSRTVAKSLKIGAHTSTFREGSVEPLRKVLLQKYLNRDFFFFHFCAQNLFLSSRAIFFLSHYVLAIQTILGRILLEFCPQTSKV